MFPNAKNDDIVDAVSQCSIWLQSNTFELGLFNYFKDLVTGKRKLPVATEQTARGVPVKETTTAIITRDQAKEYIEGHPPPLCPHPDCGHPNTWLQLDHAGDWHIHCRQCGRVDGKDAPKPIDGNLCWVEGCGLKLVGSGDNRRCQNHGQIPSSTPPSAIAFQQRAADGNRWRRLGQNALRVPDMTFPWSGRF
jgi:hypothetical protein